MYSQNDELNLERISFVYLFLHPILFIYVLDTIQTATVMASVVADCQLILLEREEKKNDI